MKRFLLKDLPSVKEFEKNLNKTFKLLSRVRNNIIGMEAFLGLTIKKRQASTYDKKMIKGFTIKKEEINQIFEMGYVTLFSHFEYFMYDLLKDLFFKFPKSLNTDVTFDEIRDISSVKKVKEYIIDSAAIKNSYSVETWLEFLKKTYAINILSVKQDREFIYMLNEVRNIIMHSGGKTNVRFRKNMGNILKTEIKIGEKHHLNMQEFFYILYKLFKKTCKNTKKL